MKDSNDGKTLGLDFKNQNSKEKEIRRHIDDNIRALNKGIGHCGGLQMRSLFTLKPQESTLPLTCDPKLDK